MENQNELRLKRENFLKRFDNVEVITGEDADGNEETFEVCSCPICLEDYTKVKTLKCGHSVCNDCYDNLKNIEDQRRSVRALYSIGDNKGKVYYQLFVKCPICREFEEPRKTQLKDENLFLKKQVADMRRNCDLVVNQLNIASQQREDARKSLIETNTALVLAQARIQELQQPRPPRPPRDYCNNLGCNRKTQRKCRDCENYCCQPCFICKYCNS